MIGDTNDDVYKSERIELFLQDNEMYNAISEIHEGPGPATYDRGTKCLDFVAVSKSIAPLAITRCGYLLFYHGIFSDHRGVYIDIKTEEIFQRALPDTNRQIYKRFTTNQIIKCERYISKLDRHLDESKIYNKVQELKREMIKHIEKGEGEKTDLINRCQIVFEKTTQLMKASERNIGKKAYSHGYPSSKVLRDAADEVIKVRKKLRYEQIKYPKDITTIEQLEADLKQKQK